VAGRRAVWPRSTGQKKNQQGKKKPDCITGPAGVEKRRDADEVPVGQPFPKEGREGREGDNGQKKPKHGWEKKLQSQNGSLVRVP